MLNIVKIKATKKYLKSQIASTLFSSFTICFCYKSRIPCTAAYLGYCKRKQLTRYELDRCAQRMRISPAAAGCINARCWSLTQMPMLTSTPLSLLFTCCAVATRRCSCGCCCCCCWQRVGQIFGRDEAALLRYSGLSSQHAKRYLLIGLRTHSYRWPVRTVGPKLW